MMDVELSQEEEALLAADDRAADRFGYWMIAVCGLVLAAIAIPLLQGAYWLKTGSWPPLSFVDALQFVGVEPAPISWVGLQRIADWIWDLPFAGVLFFAGMVSIFWITRKDDEPAALRTARMKRARKVAGWKT